MDEEQFTKDKKASDFGLWPGERPKSEGSIEDLLEVPRFPSSLTSDPESDDAGPAESPLEHPRFDPQAEFPFERAMSEGSRSSVFEPHPIDRSMESPLEYPRYEDPAPVDPGPETRSVEPVAEYSEPEVDYSEPAGPFATNFEDPFDMPFVPVEYVPESRDETVRNTGLAWSAGIAFFSSVAFCLFLGWIGDLLLGTKPWGLVGGIILGSVIGFIQFFRISSQIFGDKKIKSGPRSLMDQSDDEDHTRMF